MRLIDADMLECDTEWSEYMDGFTSYSQFQIDNAPTIDSDDGWVKCCAALPEEGRRVLVCYIKQHGVNKGKRVAAIGYIINDKFWA